MKIVAKGSMVVVVLLLTSSIAMACDCLMPEVQEGLEMARAVFQGAQWPANNAAELEVQT